MVEDLCFIFYSMFVHVDLISNSASPYTTQLWILALGRYIIMSFDSFFFIHMQHYHMEYDVEMNLSHF